MYKIVFSDLDGTLLNDEHEISPKTIDTFQRAYKKGVEFVIASGRHLRDINEMAKVLGIKLGAITQNGSIVADSSGKIVYQNLVPSDIAQEIVEMKDINPEISINFYTVEGWVAAEISEFAEDFHRYGKFECTKCDMKTVRKDNIGKIFFLGENSILKELKDKLQKIYGNKVSMAFSNSLCLELMASNVNKGEAAIAYLKSRNIEISDSIAFGDGMNDIQMLEMVGCGVVMKNACEELQEKLKDHPRAKSNAEDGLALYLEKTFLN